MTGVKDRYGNAGSGGALFQSTILIDGEFDDWAGIPAAFTRSQMKPGTPEFKELSITNDANIAFAPAEIKATTFEDRISLRATTEADHLPAFPNPPLKIFCIIREITGWSELDRTAPSVLCTIGKGPALPATITVRSVGTKLELTWEGGGTLEQRGTLGPDTTWGAGNGRRQRGPDRADWFSRLLPGEAVGPSRCGGRPRPAPWLWTPVEPRRECVRAVRRRRSARFDPPPRGRDPTSAGEQGRRWAGVTGPPTNRLASAAVWC